MGWIPQAGSMALAALALGTAPAAPAETPAQLDALSRAGESETAGLALARRQADAGDLLDALATLERVILNQPEHSYAARLYHAALLCRVDDRRGALIELDGLRGHDIDPGLRDEVQDACSGPGN
ncbi:hypothetical protein [Novosphingobium album (ex Liu et al. 2023)]|uniref:Tetratricopeptide repeat protein n=1 Tax=Novosphingobium album (ex Liu et al. 2023) TaxID=3031130 RepID=A0ABT5WMT8_9SPHN|nr:hypothetical protein [Novosphingobium album (ex Liu et al. 2023)]MDE8651346.1 hypothetical protein [Novosphingobium album (ex Liu et al. 2023)]